MALTIEINGTDYTAKWRPYESHWSRRAFMGESAGESEFVIDDDDGTINHADFATYKILRVWEDALGAPYEMFKGRITNKRLGRGPLRTGVAMRWVIQCADANYELRGIRIADSHRPEESDRERVLAYRFGYLNGSSSTNANARLSTTIDGAFVANADLITLPAEDYRDTYPDQLFRQISEFSAKTFFVYTDGDGIDHLYYASHDDTQLVADITITDDGTADGVDSYAPDVSDSSGYHDGLQVITGAGLRYGDDQFLAMDDVAGGEADHDKFEEHFFDEFVSNEQSAVDFIQSVVTSRSNEEFTYSLKWQMTAENAHRMEAGYITSIRVASANEATPINKRATQVTHRPLWPDADGNAVYEIVADFGIPRGRPFQRNIRRKPETGLAQPIETTTGLEFVGCETFTNSGGDTDAGVPSNASIGDLLVANGFLNGIGVFGDIPQVPTGDGWTAIGAGGSAGSGAQNIGQRGAWKIMEAGDAEGVQWLDAHSVIVSAWRGYDEADPIGGIAGGSGSGSTITWSAVTPEITDGSSWFVAFGGHDSANISGLSMSGSPAMSVMCGATHHGGWRTSAGSASWGSHTVSAGSSDDWVQTAYEIRAGETSTTGDTHSETTGSSTARARADHGHAFRRVGTPTATNDSSQGYRRHDIWYEVDDYDDPTDVISVWVLLDPTDGAAVWEDITPGGVDLTAVNFLVGTATGLLSAEIAVGTTPGGELGGTWASPTVDATHSGSTHTAATTTHEAASDPHTGYVLESLLDAKGDLYVASADNTPARLAVGTNDHVLTADSTQATGVKWAAAPSGSGIPATILDAKGDIIAATAADTAARLAVGTNGQVLTADSAEATGLKWGAAGTGDHGGLTGLTDDDHTQYLKETDVAAKGDIYAASANDTVGVLTVGSNGQVLTADSAEALGVKWAAAAGGGLDEGTSFPGSPAADDLFYRTDRNLIYYYDGTRWLTVNEYDFGVGWVETAAAVSGTQTMARWPVRQDFGIYLVRWVATSFQTNGTPASNFMTVTLDRVNSSNTATNIDSFVTSGDTASNWVNHDQVIDAVLDSSARILRVISTETGTVTGHILAETIIYRLIG